MVLNLEDDVAQVLPECPRRFRLKALGFRWIPVSYPNVGALMIRLMDKILHDPKDPTDLNYGNYGTFLFCG